MTSVTLKRGKIWTSSRSWFTGLPVQISDRQEPLFAADDHMFSWSTHVCHLLLQRSAAQVLPVHRVQVQGVLILNTHTTQRGSVYTDTDVCVEKGNWTVCLIPSVWLCPLYRCAPLEVPPRTQPGAWWTWAESSHTAAAESACTDPSEQCEWSPSHPVTHTNCYLHFCITFYSLKSTQ